MPGHQPSFEDTDLSDQGLTLLGHLQQR